MSLVPSQMVWEAQQPGFYAWNVAQCVAAPEGSFAVGTGLTEPILCPSITPGRIHVIRALLKVHGKTGCRGV